MCNPPPKFSTRALGTGRESNEEATRSGEVIYLHNKRKASKMSARVGSLERQKSLPRVDGVGGLVLLGGHCDGSGSQRLEVGVEVEVAGGGKKVGRADRFSQMAEARVREGEASTEEERLASQSAGTDDQGLRLSRTGRRYSPAHVPVKCLGTWALPVPGQCHSLHGHPK